MRVSLLMIMGLVCRILSAQDLMVNMTNLQGNIVRLENRYESIQGSPFIYDEFLEGYVKIGNSTLLGVFMRYNKFTQKIEVQRENGEVIELNPGGVKEIGMNRQRPNVYEMKFSRLEERWMEELESGLVYKVHRVRLQEAAQPEYNTAKLHKKFIDISQYYVRKGEELVAFTLRKKDILEVVNRPEEIKAFVKENKLKWNDEGDVIEILKKDREMS